MTEPASLLPAGVSRAETLVLLQALLERIEGRLARQERLAGPGQRPALEVFQVRLSELAARFRALLAQLDGGFRHEREARQVLFLQAGVPAGAPSLPGSPLFRRQHKLTQEQAGLEQDLELLARLAHKAAGRFPDGDLQGEFAGCITLSREAHALPPNGPGRRA